MAQLSLKSVTKHFGSVVAVSGVDLDLPDGQLISFLGPSGSGKTTLFRLVAGLEPPTAGAVFLDGKDITGIPTHKRNVGMVFQSFALFPHLTVGQNVAYGLRIRGIDKQTRKQRIDELLELVRMPDVADRHISQLSGGQQQRVAMARALALEPVLFLLDEPLSALDAKLREAMQVELRQLQKRLGITTIVVTHDQREAMTISDYVVVLDEGVVQQVGPPLEIYRRPANPFVADFIGSSNLLDGHRDGANSVAVQDRRFAVSTLPDDIAPDQPATLCIRPEEVSVEAGAVDGENRLPGTVTFVRDLGFEVETYIDCAGVTVISLASPRDRVNVQDGDAVTVHFPEAACIGLRR